MIRVNKHDMRELTEGEVKIYRAVPKTFIVDLQKAVERQV
jgi:hypothetical protein